MKLLTLYLILINALAFLLMLIDKHHAQKKLWRIPQSVLFVAAFIGGSVGTFLGMKLFRHKTRHLSFAVGVPIMIVIHAVILYDLTSLGVIYGLFT